MYLLFFFCRFGEAVASCLFHIAREPLVSSRLKKLQFINWQLLKVIYLRKDADAASLSLLEIRTRTTTSKNSCRKSGSELYNSGIAASLL